MTGDSRQENRDSSFNQRGYSDRGRRGRGVGSRGEVRGNRQKSEFRGRNSKGNFENKRDYGSYPPFRSQQQIEEPNQQVRPAKFDANKLSDPNEFPTLNDMSSQTRSSRNSRRFEDSNQTSQNASSETKKFTWRGQGQNMIRKNHEMAFFDKENKHITKQTNDGVATPNYDRNYDNSNRMNRGNYQYSNRGGRNNNRRTNDGSRRNIRVPNIQPANFDVNPQQYENPQPAEEPYLWYKLPGMFWGPKIAIPPSMADHDELMPGDSKQDHDDCNYYKTRVNDDTLDNTIRVQSQLEFYFSNFNLRTDTYLRDMMDHEGYVNMDKILEFNRMVKLKTTKELLKTVVESSDKLEYDEKKERIRRINEPLQWTTIGLLMQFIPVYMAYLAHPYFSRWYCDSLAWLHRTLYPNFQFPMDYSVIPEILVSISRQFDYRTHQVYTVVLLYYFIESEYVCIGEIRNIVIPTQFYLSLHDPMKGEYLAAEDEHYDTVDQNSFIDVMKSYTLTNDNPVVETEDKVSELTTITSELSLEEDSINFKNTKTFSKSKPAPAKYDRHSANQQKNIKQEKKRDVIQQVQDGLLSYNHEFSKKSNSTHGSLSGHPEAASKVFVSAAPPCKKDTKENKEKNTTVVEGSNIIRDKNIINEAIEKARQGDEEPIVISTNIKKHHKNNAKRGQKDGKKTEATTKSRLDSFGTDGQARSK